MFLCLLRAPFLVDETYPCYFWKWEQTGSWRSEYWVPLISDMCTGVKSPPSELQMMKSCLMVSYLIFIKQLDRYRCSPFLFCYSEYDMRPSPSILLLFSGKCLSISDAIGRRLRDGDKIRYKVWPDKIIFVPYIFCFSVEADAKIDTRIKNTEERLPSAWEKQSVEVKWTVNCTCIVKQICNGIIQIIQWKMEGMKSYILHNIPALSVISSTNLFILVTFCFSSVSFYHA